MLCNEDRPTPSSLPACRGVARAARQLARPIVVTWALTLIAFLATSLPQPARAAERSTSFTASALVERHGVAELLVDGQPFFLNGAAFFYERLPHELWAPSIARLRALGINTIDVYIPWNWHELADGDFDFDGHSNPRRDLRDVLRLVRAANMHVVVRRVRSHIAPMCIVTAKVRSCCKTMWCGWSSHRMRAPARLCSRISRPVGTPLRWSVRYATMFRSRRRYRRPIESENTRARFRPASSTAPTTRRSSLIRATRSCICATQRRMSSPPVRASNERCGCGRIAARSK